MKVMLVLFFSIFLLGCATKREVPKDTPKVIKAFVDICYENTPDFNVDNIEKISRNWEARFIPINFGEDDKILLFATKDGEMIIELKEIDLLGYLKSTRCRLDTPFNKKYDMRTAFFNEMTKTLEKDGLKYEVGYDFLTGLTTNISTKINGKSVDIFYDARASEMFFIQSRL